MRYALNLNADGRILSATYEKYAAENMPIVDALPEGNISDYIYRNGEYIHDPLPKTEPEQPKQPDDLSDRIASLEEALEMILNGVTE